MPCGSRVDPAGITLPCGSRVDAPGMPTPVGFTFQLGLSLTIGFVPLVTSTPSLIQSKSESGIFGFVPISISCQSSSQSWSESGSNGFVPCSFSWSNVSQSLSSSTDHTQAWMMLWVSCALVSVVVLVLVVVPSLHHLSSRAETQLLIKTDRTNHIIILFMSIILINLY